MDVKPENQNPMQQQAQPPRRFGSDDRHIGIYVLLLILAVIVVLGILAFKAITGQPANEESLENPTPPGDVDTNPF